MLLTNATDQHWVHIHRCLMQYFQCRLDCMALSCYVNAQVKHDNIFIGLYHSGVNSMLSINKLIDYATRVN